MMKKHQGGISSLGNTNKHPVILDNDEKTMGKNPSDLDEDHQVDQFGGFRDQFLGPIGNGHFDEMIMTHTHVWDSGIAWLPTQKWVWVREAQGLALECPVNSAGFSCATRLKPSLDQKPDFQIADFMLNRFCK